MISRRPQGIYSKKWAERILFLFLDFSVVRTTFSDSNGHFKKSSERGGCPVINSVIRVQLEILIKI